MKSTEIHQQATLQRRNAIKALALLTGSALLGCTPLNAGSGTPSTTKDDPEDSLKAFVETIVPGVPANHEGITRHFYISGYPLAKYRNLLVRDLKRRSRKMFKADSFDSLNLEQRSKVVRGGLASNVIISRLYSGAIFLTQIFIYTGLYNNGNGCPIIDFPGRYRFQVTSYKNADAFLGRALTQDGNPS